MISDFRGKSGKVYKNDSSHSDTSRILNNSLKAIKVSVPKDVSLNLLEYAHIMRERENWRMFY